MKWEINATFRARNSYIKYNKRIVLTFNLSKGSVERKNDISLINYIIIRMIFGAGIYIDTIIIHK